VRGRLGVAGRVKILIVQRALKGKRVCGVSVVGRGLGRNKGPRGRFRGRGWGQRFPSGRE